MNRWLKAYTSELKHNEMKKMSEWELKGGEAEPRVGGAGLRGAEGGRGEGRCFMGTPFLVIRAPLPGAMFLRVSFLSPSHYCRSSVGGF